MDVLVLLLVGIDAYYLSMERDFINVSRAFVKAMHDGSAQWSDVFTTPGIPQGLERLRRTLTAFGSPSVWPFYLVIFIVPLVLQCCMVKPSVPSSDSGTPQRILIPNPVPTPAPQTTHPLPTPPAPAPATPAKP